MLQARLLLLRPLLFRFCLEPPPEPPTPTLRHRVLRECAHLCVTTAQSLFATIAAHHPADGTVGLLPAWWYRLYYVYTAATILVVARLRADFFVEGEVRASWDVAMGVLSRHEKFGRSARRCIAVLNILSEKAFQETAGKGGGEEKAGRIDHAMDQLFDGVGEYPDVTLAGLNFDASDFTAFNVQAWGLVNCG